MCTCITYASKHMYEMCALLLTWLLTFAAVLPTKDKKNPLSPTSLYNKRIHKSPSLLPVQSPPPTAAYQHPSAAGKIFSLIFPIPTKSQTNKTNCSPPTLKRTVFPRQCMGRSHSLPSLQEFHSRSTSQGNGTAPTSQGSMNILVLES